MNENIEALSPTRWKVRIDFLMMMILLTLSKGLSSPSFRRREYREKLSSRWKGSRNITGTIQGIFG
jgi:hypothetical protein